MLASKKEEKTCVLASQNDPLARLDKGPFVKRMVRMRMRSFARKSTWGPG
jgi:hypothetical protein